MVGLHVLMVVVARITKRACADATSCETLDEGMRGVDGVGMPEFRACFTTQIWRLGFSPATSSIL